MSTLYINFYTFYIDFTHIFALGYVNGVRKL